MHIQALDSKKPGLRRRLKLAIIGGPGTAQLRAGLCASSVRRGFLVNTFVVPGDSYRELLSDESSDLCAFAPDVILAAIDAAQVQPSGPRPGTCLHLAKQHLGASIIQRTILSALPSMIEAERTYDSYPSPFFEGPDSKLRTLAYEAGIRLMFPKNERQSEVLVTWSEGPLWNRKIREASPNAGLLQGNCLGTLLAALGGLSYSCLMLDVRNHSHLTETNDLLRVVTDIYRAGNFTGLEKTGIPVLDSVLLVDDDPFASKMRRRQSSIYTMPSHGDR